MNTGIHITATDGDTGNRLDRFLVAHLPELSRSRIKALIESGQVSLTNGTTLCDPARKVKSGDALIIIIPPPEPATPEAQPMPLDIVCEDRSLLVINKPAGLTVHPAPGNPDRTLVNALLAHCGESLSGIGGVARPGIVHRLDKDTSGLMVVAKTDAAHRFLSEQIESRSMKRTYQAIVWGTPSPAAGTIQGNIGRSPRNRKKMAVVNHGGKHAVTHYRVLEPLGIASLVECRLETGRTHQIRVHMAHFGHPLLGDPLYGNLRRQCPDVLLGFLKDFGRQALHACALQLTLPETNKEQIFTSTLPADIQSLLDLLRHLK